MSDHLFRDVLDQNEAAELHIRAAKVFTPRVPIGVRELFAGRWPQMTRIADSVSQKGLHVIIYGERGVGKTSLANVIPSILHAFDDLEHEKKGEKENVPRLVIQVNACEGDQFSTIWCRALDEIWWEEDRPRYGFRPDAASDQVKLRDAFGLGEDLKIDDVRRVVRQLPGSVFVFDEFDRTPPETRNIFTDLIKACSDFAIDVTLVLVGVSETVDTLIENHASISRAMTQIHLPRMGPQELAEIISNGEKALNMSFAEDAKTRIIRMSHGLPHYTHLVAQFAAREACKVLSRTVSTEHVEAAFRSAAEQALQTVKDEYTKAVHSSHRDALYPSVILACAMAAANAIDDAGYFQAAAISDPLQSILPDREVTVSTFNKHIGEFCETKRGSILERTGSPRGYKYRFRNPLLPPYIVMNGVSTGQLEHTDWLSA